MFADAEPSGEDLRGWVSEGCRELAQRQPHSRRRRMRRRRSRTGNLATPPWQRCTEQRLSRTRGYVHIVTKQCCSQADTPGALGRCRYVLGKAAHVHVAQQK